MLNYLENQQIDQVSASLRELKAMLNPKEGWIKTIREALGMTSAQLARRLEVNPSRITRIEEDELRRALTLQTLYETADALESDFIYAFVPKKNIKDILRTRAKAIAESKLQRLQHTMALEDQALNSAQYNTTLEHHIDQLLHGPLKYLWEDNNNENHTKPRDHSA